MEPHMIRTTITVLMLMILITGADSQTSPGTFYGFTRGSTREEVRKQLGNATWNDNGLDVALGRYVVTSKGYTFNGQGFQKTVLAFTRSKVPRLSMVSLFLDKLSGEQAMSILETFEKAYQGGIVRDRISARLRASCGFSDGTSLSVAIHDQDETSIDLYRVQISITWR
jgi:hypothetical protein